MSLDPNISSLVSVIIPCYNHSQYLPKAIESVLEQSYSLVEIIVVDDGSTDNTRTIAQRYPQVTFVHQSNSGLSASRNTGIQHSTGEYLVFLDADDWLYPEALATNLKYLQHNEQLAFVSGSYDRIHVEENIVKAIVNEVPSNIYEYLLSNGNFIGVPAAVMYQRWVFDALLFDTTLKACEDYDLYLKISRKYPVLHHTGKIAAYRIHAANMSSNIPLMLKSALRVLERQGNSLKTIAERNAFKKGKVFWTNYYCKEYYKKIKRGTVKNSKKDLFKVFKHQPRFFLKYLMDRF